MTRQKQQAKLRHLSDVISPNSSVSDYSSHPHSVLILSLPSHILEPQGSVLGPVLFVLFATPLSDIIASHSVKKNHQLFPDDTQLQKSASLSQKDNPTKEICACTNDIKTWVTENQLKDNDDKTGALLFLLSFLRQSLPPFSSLTRLLSVVTTLLSLIHF